MSAPTGSALRALRSSATPRAAARTFASTATASQTAGESSQKYSPYYAIPGETKAEAWKRNLEEAKAWRRRKELERENLSVFIPEGASAPPRGRPNPTPAEASLSTLLAAGAALGHSPSLTSRAYKPYIYGTRAGLSIIDLDQTLPILRRTAALVRDVVKADGVVLFVGIRDGHQKIIQKAKERLEDNGYATSKWMPGLLTNSEALFGLEPLKQKRAKPDLVVFLTPGDNTGAIRECTMQHVPSIGIVDSDLDPRIVTYPIPANTESIRTTELIIGALSVAGKEGRRLRIKEAMTKAGKLQNQSWQMRGRAEDYEQE
ncbi:hypothetical protein IAT38_007140 [Cryptococcus sp. DSM 104549]